VKTNLYLIRHGESISAVEHRVGNLGLTPLGVRQAEHLRDRLAGTGEIDADVLISSTLLRARQTAEIIAPALGLPIIFDEEVEEMRVGEAEGMTVTQFRETFGMVNAEEDPFKPIAPGAESWAQFMYRMGRALYRISHQYEGKTIVVVCHGGIIEGSFYYFFGLSTLRGPQAHFSTRNTSITHWQQFGPQGQDKPPRWRLKKYDDDMHLRDIDTPVRIPWKELRPRPVSGSDQPIMPVETE
jgi:2,3-bisphosphoglycerate-dependent phosphoglycerate mutase